MRFSWTSVILAPLLVPVMFSLIGAAMLVPQAATRFWDF
jgi:hypothetical protein